MAHKPAVVPKPTSSPMETGSFKAVARAAVVVRTER